MADQASPTEINGRLNALAEQRNSALDSVALIRGAIDVLREENASLRKLVAQLEGEKKPPIKVAE